jgi:hypothetical protein
VFGELFFVGPGTCLCRTIFWLLLTINHHYFFKITIHNINYDCPNINNLFCNYHPGSVFKKHNAYIEFLYPCCYILHIYIRWLTHFGCLNIYGRKRGREGVKQYMHSFHYYHCLQKFLFMITCGNYYRFFVKRLYLRKNLQDNMCLKNIFLSYSSILKFYPWEQLKSISFYSNFL